MAQTRTYSDLIATIQGKFGAHTGFTSSELTSIKQLVNSRIQDLFLESEFWENILVIGEERAVDTSGTTPVMPYTGAVFDATDGATDQNPYEGAVDAFQRIHKVNPWSDKSALEYQFAGITGGARLVGYKSAFGLSKTVDSATAAAGTVTIELAASVYVDYYVGGQINLSSFATTPEDINGAQTVTAVNNASYLAGRTQVQFELTGASGSWSLTGDETAETETAFATYKKRIIDTVYGDGSGETTAIPLEWFEACACGVVADLHSGDGSEGKANKWEAKYRKALDLRLDRLHSQHAHETVGMTFATHLSEQGRDLNF